MTADKDNLLKISKDYSDFTNTKSVWQRLLQMMQTSLLSSLADRTHLHIFAPVAENIKIAPLSAYDQGCVELSRTPSVIISREMLTLIKQRQTLRLLLKSVILRSLRLNGRNNVDSSEDFVCKNILQNTIKKIMSM